MNNYELTIVLAGKVTPAKIKAYKEKLDKLVKLNKGNIKKSDDWGEVELAYKIKKNTTGTFLHFILELESKSVKNVSDKLRVDEDIIRHLLIRSLI